MKKIVLILMLVLTLFNVNAQKVQIFTYFDSENFTSIEDSKFFLTLNNKKYEIDGNFQLYLGYFFPYKSNIIAVSQDQLHSNKFQISGTTITIDLHRIKGKKYFYDIKNNKFLKNRKRYYPISNFYKGYGIVRNKKGNLLIVDEKLKTYKYLPKEMQYVDKGFNKDGAIEMLDKDYNYLCIIDYKGNIVKILN